MPVSGRALAVLAGGRAERLGGLIKPLLKRPDGRTLIDHLLSVLSPLVDETLIVAPAELAALFSGRVIEDPGSGPGLALAAAARATSRDTLLLVAGDHVAPSAELAERLLAHGSAVVSLDGVLQPTFASYSTRAVRAIDPALQSLRAVLAAVDPFVIDAHQLDAAMLASFEDVDTAADLVRHGLSSDGVPTWSHLAGDQG